jgi:hypothetical protein
MQPEDASKEFQTVCRIVILAQFLEQLGELVRPLIKCLN